MRENRFLGEFASVEQEWEGVLSGIWIPDFLNLNGAVCQEEVDLEEVEPALHRPVIPEHIKREHLPVKLQVLLQPIVRVPAAQLNLKVLFVLFRVGKRDFRVLQLLLHFEVVDRHWLCCAQLQTLVFEKFFRELVALGYSENPVI